MSAAKNILVTGGRAPATLELIRNLQHSGHRIFVAESLSTHLSRFSRHVYQSIQVPPPRTEPDAYGRALLTIIAQHRIDYLLPTCEEVFWVARHYDALAAVCDVLTMPRLQLRQLHSKVSFLKLAQAAAQQNDVQIPNTTVIESHSQLQHQLQAVRAARPKPCDTPSTPTHVLKPEYSRFGAQVLFAPFADEVLEQLEISAQRRWVLQEFVAGKALCSWSVARAAKLTVHCAYEPLFTAGPGSAIAFSAVDDARIQAFTAALAKSHNVSGQIAFDFIEDASGTLWVLECNPRLTSGAHLFSSTVALHTGLLGSGEELITPTSPAPVHMAIPMLLWGLPSLRSWSDLTRWLRTVCTARDVVFSWSDPLPSLLQWVPIVHLFARGLRLGLGPLAASTADIEWNGES